MEEKLENYYYSALTFVSKFYDYRGFVIIRKRTQKKKKKSTTVCSSSTNLGKFASCVFSKFASSIHDANEQKIIWAITMQKCQTYKSIQ